MAMLKSTSRFSASGSAGSVNRKPKQPIEGSLCVYPHRTCCLERLERYDYCLKHILEDKNAPFKQCNYVSNKNGKRCPNGAPKTDRKDGYCSEHARRALMFRQRAHRKRKPRETPESLLTSVEHYASKTLGGQGGNGMDTRRIRGADSVTNRILDYPSSSDSDSDGVLVDQSWPGDADSDADSVDSEHEDPLKHAGIYTAEEVALITRDKLIRLQSLYIDQFKRLQHVMREKRRKYIHNVRQEREALGSIHAVKDDLDQRDKYLSLMATKRYHHRYGKEALVHRQAKERRLAVSEGANYRPPAYAKCIYSEDMGNKCSARTIPLSKYCPIHVMHDHHQLLYKACDFAHMCLTPVAQTSQLPRCQVHHELRNIQQRYPRPEEDTDDEEDVRDHTVDVVGSPDVKIDVVNTDADTVSMVAAIKKEPMDVSGSCQSYGDGGVSTGEKDRLCSSSQQSRTTLGVRIKSEVKDDIKIENV